MKQHDDSDLPKQTIIPLAQRWQAVLGRQTAPRSRPMAASALSLQVTDRLQARLEMQAPVARALRRADQASDEGGAEGIQAPTASLHAPLQVQPVVGRGERQMAAQERTEADAIRHSDESAFVDLHEDSGRNPVTDKQRARPQRRFLGREVNADPEEFPDRGAVLDTRIQTMLANMLELRLPVVTVRADAQADAVARSFAADAVAYHDTILFRAGKFAPHTPAGLALLGHELTHIAAAHDRSMQRPGASAGGDGEEAAALHNEARVAHQLAMEPSRLRFPVSPALVALASPSPASRVAANPGSQPAPVAVAAPKTALSTRTLPGEGSSPRAATPDLSAQQLKTIKDAVYRDILDRIRTDFERGA